MSTLRIDGSLVSLSKVQSERDLMEQGSKQAKGSPAALQPRCLRPEVIARRTAWSLAKGAAIGSVCNTALSILTGIPALARSAAKSPRTFVEVLLRLVAQRSHLDMGVFVGVLSATIKATGLLLEGPNAARRRAGLFIIPDALQPWRGALMGLATGGAFAILPEKYRQTMTFFTLVRALEVLGKAVVATGRVPGALQHDHSDVLLMMASSGVCMWSWIFYPHLAVPSVRVERLLGGLGVYRVYRVYGGRACLARTCTRSSLSCWSCVGCVGPTCTRMFYGWRLFAGSVFAGGCCTCDCASIRVVRVVLFRALGVCVS
jgi:hypothetical protein